MARLEVTPSSGPAPLRITADGTASTAGKGVKITSYDFDFGDGNTTGPQSKATSQTHLQEARYLCGDAYRQRLGSRDPDTMDVGATESPPP